MTNLLRVTLFCTLAALGVTTSVLGQQYQFERSVGEISINNVGLIAPDAQGNLFIIDQGQVIKTTGQGSFLGVLTRKGDGINDFKYRIDDIKYSNDGNLWVKSYSQIKKLSPNGTTLLQFQALEKFNGMFTGWPDGGMAPDDQGNLWVLTILTSGLAGFRNLDQMGNFYYHQL